MSIPAKALVNVIPGVLGAGGAAVALNGLMLTANTAVPLGTVAQFASAQAVSDFFGPASDEYSLAQNYFTGPDNSLQKPANLLFAQFPTAPVSAYLRSGSFKGVPLATIKAITPGTMSVTVDSVVKTSTPIDLSGATSYANAATLIAAAFTGPSAPVVTFDAQRQSFLFTSPTTGATSTITFGSGAISAALKATQATAAVTSQGSAAGVPSTVMGTIVAAAQNWASFMTVFEPLLADKILFGTWAAQQNNRYAYVVWDTDVNTSVDGNTTAYGPQAKLLNLSGSYCLSADPARAAALGVTMQSLVRPLAAFTMGIAASLDFTATNGRETFAYQSQAGIVPGVASETIGNNLIANGYNFYGDYATSSQSFLFMQNGQIIGDFAWADSFYNQIWMNSAFQQSLLSLMVNIGSLPYSPAGYSQIETALLPNITDALDFGAIRAGVTLSGSQIAAVNAAAGKNIASVISTRGWYLNITDPGATVRVARGSPNMTFYYADGGSIQKMVLASINIQ